MKKIYASLNGKRSTSSKELTADPRVLVIVLAPFGSGLLALWAKSKAWYYIRYDFKNYFSSFGFIWSWYSLDIELYYPIEHWAYWSFGFIYCDIFILCWINIGIFVWS